MEQVAEDFDPDLPNASAVLASLCCVITQYSKNPNANLARLALELSRKLGSKTYYESSFISAIGLRLEEEWSRKLMQETGSPVITDTAVH
ncbi:MAG TPA: hypothetical protein VD810_08965 [Methylophilaceae bacterium]|nr:hypothetical protein [Methylophilaceae bacterium]